MNHQDYLWNIESNFEGGRPLGFCFVWGIWAQGEEYSLCTDCAAKQMAEDTALWVYASELCGYQRLDNKADKSVAISSYECAGAESDLLCKSCGTIACEGRHFDLRHFDDIQMFNISGHPQLGEHALLCAKCAKGMFDDPDRFGLYGGIHYKGNTLWADATNVTLFTSEESVDKQLVCERC